MIRTRSAACFVCIQRQHHTQDGVVFSLYFVGCMLLWLGCRCPKKLLLYMSILTMLAHWGSDICCGLVWSCLVYVHLMCWAWVGSSVGLGAGICLVYVYLACWSWVGSSVGLGVGSCIAYVYVMCWAWVWSSIGRCDRVMFSACLPYELGLDWVKYWAL